MSKIVQFKLEYILSSTIAIIIVLWTLSGFIFNKKNNHDVINYKLENLLPVVKTKNIILEKKDIFVNLYGIVDSLNVLDIKSEVTGKVSEIVAKEGYLIKKGDVILKIDDKRQKILLEKAIALLAQRKIEYAAEEELFQKGYGAKSKLASALTNLKDAENFLKNSEIDLENTVIKSPVDGIIDKIQYNVGEMIVAVNSVLTRLHTLNNYIAYTFIPEKQISDIKIDSNAVITLANGKILDGKVGFVSNIANPDTKTYRIELSFVSEEILPVGMTAKINLPLKTDDVYFIDNNAIFLNDSGFIGIKILNSEKVAHFIPVQILSEENNGFWVKPKMQMANEAVMITLGGNFVRDGDKVALE